MNIAQKMIFDTILSKTSEENKAQVKALLDEIAEKQADGLDMNDITSVAPKLASLVKEEFADELQAILSKFAK